MIVAPLTAHPEAVPVLAGWFAREWGGAGPQDTVEGIARRLAESPGERRLPLRLVGLVDGEPAAAAILKYREIEYSDEADYWLGSVYVREDLRGRGHGGTMVAAAEAVAAARGLTPLYLYTPRKESWYRRLGWEPVGRTTADGKPAVVMTRFAGTTIRPASAADAEAITRIYGHYVTDSIVTFEEVPPEVTEMARRMEEVRSAGLPWLVAERDGRVVGYAYATRWHERSAYRFSAETTVYVDREHGRRGAGTLLYARLLTLLREGGLHTAIGLVALPNEASVALHEKLGFEKAAHLRHVGRKLGRWIDVGFWQAILRGQGGVEWPAAGMSRPEGVAGRGRVPGRSPRREESYMTDRRVVGKKTDVAAVPMAGEGIEGVVKRVLVSPEQGWDGWVMRLFDVEPGGHTPKHAHDWPHINFVAAGHGALFLDGVDSELEAGSFAYVPAGHEHQFRAAADEPLSFVCIVPEAGEA